MPDIFFGTSGPRNADIAILGEAWGSEEEKKQRPFVGYSGQELDRILAECGIARDDCFCTNIIAKKPYNNELRRLFYKTKPAKKENRECIGGLYPKPEIMQGLEILRQQLKVVQPKVIIALGNYPLWALTDGCFSLGNQGIPKDPEGTWKVPTGITQWRGSQLTTREDMGSFLMVPTYHPAAVMRQWPWRADLKHDILHRAKPGAEGKWKKPEYNFIIRPSFETVIAKLELLLQVAAINLEPLELAWDLETHAGNIDCLGIATSPRDAICIPFMDVEAPYHYWSSEEEFAIICLIRELFLHPNVNLFGQNISYDLQYTALYWWLLPKTAFDTMIAQHLCWPGRQKALYYISSMYCEYHVYWKDEGKKFNPKLHNKEQHWTYNCKDAVTTWEGARELRKLLKHFNLEEQFIWQMDSMELTVDMMLKGVNIDTKLRPKMSFELMEATSEYEEYFYAMIPWKEAGKGKPWWRSPKKQMDLFYNDLGVKKQINRKTKQPTVDADALIEIARIEPLLRPIIEHMAEYRSAGVFQSTFIQAKLDPDNRMRCSYDVTGTETFRWNSRKNAFDRGTNLQNIPEGDEE